MNILHYYKQYRIPLIIAIFLSFIGLSCHIAYKSFKHYYSHVPEFCPRDKHQKQENPFKTNPKLAQKEFTKYFLRSFNELRPCLKITNNSDLPNHVVPPLFSCDQRQPEELPADTMETRWQMDIYCEGSRSYAIQREVPFHQPIHTLRSSAQMRCLEQYIRQNCYDGRPVPDVVHLVQFGEPRMKFRRFLGLYSVLTVAKPRLVLFHSDMDPEGPLWQILLRVARNMIRVYKKPQTHVRWFTKIKFVQNMADIARIEVLIENGGIYLDTDVVLTKKLDILREVNFAAAREGSMPQMTNNALIARKGHCLLKEWLANWRTYGGDSWVSHSIWKLTDMSKNNPQFMESLTSIFSRYGYYHTGWLYRHYCSMAGSFGAHLYSLGFPGAKNDFEYIKRANTTYGRLARFVVFGDSQLCPLQ